MSKAHAIALNGVSFALHASGALISDDRCVFVADLHLEHGTSLARRGVHVPPFDTTQTLNALKSLLKEVDATRLYLLGDSFHALQSVNLDLLHAALGGIESHLISGNHDPSELAEADYRGITLRHEPSSKLSGFEISGHLHPGATVIQRGAAVRGKCFISDNNRIILPAFGAYTGAFDVRQKPFEGLFDKVSTNVHIIGRSGIYKFPLKRVL